MSTRNRTSAFLPFDPTDRDHARLDDELRAVAQDETRTESRPSRRSLRDRPRGAWDPLRRRVRAALRGAQPLWLHRTL